MLNAIWRRVGGKRRSLARKRGLLRPVTLAVESLEDRRLLAIAQYDAGALANDGTPDTFDLSVEGSDLRVVIDGTPQALVPLNTIDGVCPPFRNVQRLNGLKTCSNCLLLSG
jgi:hypothetical protein